MSEQATYVYCVVRSSRRPPLGRGPRGLPGCEPPRALDLGDGLWLVVADAPLGQYGAEALDAHIEDPEWVSPRAVAHEEVVEHASRAGPIVPMKLFTMFSTDKRATAQMRRVRAKLERTLERVAGCEEWSVRVRFDLGAARAVAQQREREQRGRGGSGSAYLQRKKRVRDDRQELTREIRERADALFEELAERTAEAHRRPPVQLEGNRRVLLDAVFLVPRRRVRGFERRVRSVADDLEPEGYDIVLSGPWPPYHFVEERP